MEGGSVQKGMARQCCTDSSEYSKNAAPVATPMAHATSRTAASGSSYFMPSPGVCLAFSDSAQHSFALQAAFTAVVCTAGRPYGPEYWAMCWFVNLTCNTLGLRGRQLVTEPHMRRYITSCKVLICTTSASCLSAKGLCLGVCGLQRAPCLSAQGDAFSRGYGPTGRQCTRHTRACVMAI